MPRTTASALLLSLATLSVSALVVSAPAQSTNPAVRDSYSALNFVQGQATLDGRPVTTDLSGTPRILHPGQTLATTDGTADVMLVPGSLLRLGQNTTVQIVAGNNSRAEARIESGRANVAVNALAPTSLLLVDMPNGQTQLLKRGLYSFDVPSETARVFNGEALAFPGSDTGRDVPSTKVKDGKEVLFGGERVHAVKFDTQVAANELLPWTGPQEAHADGYYGLTSGGGEGVVGNAGYLAAADYGYSPYALGFGFGGGYPYGYGFGGGPGFGFGYPFGFGYGYGYPIGLGLYGGGYGYGGFGYGGYGGYGGNYGGRRVIGGAGLRGGQLNGYARSGGYSRGAGTAGIQGGGGGFHGGGFSGGGGGFHGGGGGGHR